MSSASKLLCISHLASRIRIALQTLQQKRFNNIANENNDDADDVFPFVC